MADYRRFQPRRTTPSLNWRLWLFVFGGLLIVVLLGMWAFGDHGKKTSDSNGEPAVSLLNDQNANGATNTGLTNDDLLNSNANANTNTSAVATTPADAATVQRILSACTGPVSQVGEAAKVALTFDVVGDNPALTQAIAALTAAKIPATFFITGSYATTNASVVTQIKAAGFRVYSRGTSTSKKYTTMEAAAITTDLAKAETAISDASGQSSKPFYRPPQGATNATSVAAIKAAGYCPVTWTVDAYDWNDGQTAEASVTRVLAALKPGAIVLLGAGNDITPAIVTSLATEIPKKGYTFSDLAGLFQ